MRSTDRAAARTREARSSAPPGYAARSMPPTPRPLPTFIADSPQEGKPYGRWAERLVEEFAVAAEPLADEAGVAFDREAVKWLSERAWGGRVYVPLTARAATEGGERIEYFGHVSFVRPPAGTDGEEREPGGVRASADFCDVTAD